LLPIDPNEKSAILRDAEEVFRLLYGMVESILLAKEEEEKAWQAAEARDGHRILSTEVIINLVKLSL